MFYSLQIICTNAAGFSTTAKKDYPVKAIVYPVKGKVMCKHLHH